MDIRPDEWEQIIDRGLQREVEGELPSNLAHLVRMRAPQFESEREPSTWIWWIAGVVLSLSLVLAHMILAWADYRAVGNELAALMSVSRIDLVTAAVVAAGLMEVVARTFVAARPGREADL